MNPIFLLPGTICCPAEASVVTTILGSCVAVCLWDRHRRIGGMNHFLLPRCRDGQPSARYGDIAFAHLLAAMERLGCKPANLRAKVFGGAAVLPFGLHSETVGAHNISVALDALRLHGIPILARRTGGQRGLFLRFHTELGRVMVRELSGAPGIAAGLRTERSLSGIQNNPSALSAVSISNGIAANRAWISRSRAIV
jgi:chemotaxis protein CheD